MPPWQTINSQDYVPTYKGLLSSMGAYQSCKRSSKRIWIQQDSDPHLLQAQDETASSYEAAQATKVLRLPRQGEGLWVDKYHSLVRCSALLNYITSLFDDNSARFITDIEIDCDLGQVKQALQEPLRRGESAMFLHKGLQDPKGRRYNKAHFTRQGFTENAL